MGNRRIRFQVSLVMAILTIILLMTAASLIGVNEISRRAAERSANLLFTQVSQLGYDRVDRLIGEAVSLARLGSRSTRPVQVTGDGREAPVVSFLAEALAVNPALYSVYYGLADGSFLQLIATRGEARILAAHDSPAETRLILRAITGQGAERRETRSFLGADGRLLGAITDPAPRYDPRQRPWYVAAMAADDARLSQPYLFDSLQQPGLTASHRLADGAGAFGVDLTLDGLQAFVEQQSILGHGGVALLDAGGRLLAIPRRLSGTDLPPLADLGQQTWPVAKAILHALATLPEGQTGRVETDGEVLLARTLKWRSASGDGVTIAALGPYDDFVGHIRQMRDTIIALAGAILLVVVPIAVVISRQLSKVVKGLAGDAARIRHFDFSGHPPANSWIVEFHQLAEAFGLMKSSIAEKTRALSIAEAHLRRLVDLGIAMSAERDTDRLMETILKAAKELTNADGGSLYVRDDRDRLQFRLFHNDSLDLVLGGTSDRPTDRPPVPLFLDDGSPNHRNVVSHAVHCQATVNIPDASDTTEFDFSGTRAFDRLNGYHSQSLLTIPLKPHDGEVIGALQLINARLPGTSQVVPFPREIERFIEALAAQAGTALLNLDLQSAQNRLMEGMVLMIANAIDAKSPYTGGHCLRVPELAVMLAEEACRSTDGGLAGFRLGSREEWNEFRIGALLHDCGKLVTPDYVIDKATKLETVYNRIHEIRTRFEVLWRDTEIDCLQAILDGGDPAEARQRRTERQARLTDDFAFLAACNQGSEAIPPESLERIGRLAGTPWLRHFDDRLGLGQAELTRLAGRPCPPLPCPEPLLADRPEHIQPWPGNHRRHDEAMGFKLVRPTNMANDGELYNLTIGRGTLTAEERYRVNEHIIQTIEMLERLPFPRQLRRVPEYAGTHHETLTGTGYPRRLDASELSIPARIMAIADIFEALTASDRPYKRAKSLSESISILAGLCQQGQIDPDLFRLFLASGVYRRYAERFLSPEQIDAVDIAPYMDRG